MPFFGSDALTTKQTALGTPYALYSSSRHVTRAVSATRMCEERMTALVGSPVIKTMPSRPCSLRLANLHQAIERCQWYE